MGFRPTILPLEETYADGPSKVMEPPESEVQNISNSDALQHIGEQLRDERMELDSLFSLACLLEAGSSSLRKSLHSVTSTVRNALRKNFCLPELPGPMPQNK